MCDGVISYTIFDTIITGDTRIDSQYFLIIA